MHMLMQDISANENSAKLPTILSNIRTYRKSLISCLLAVYIFYQIVFIPFEFFINPKTKRLRKSAKYISSSYGYGLCFVVFATAVQPTIVNVLLGFGMLFCMIVMTIGLMLKIKIITSVFNIIGQVCGLYIGISVLCGGWVQA
jgi:hypothetical protein